MPPGCGLRVMLSERSGFVAVPNCENDNQNAANFNLVILKFCPVMLGSISHGALENH